LAILANKRRRQGNDARTSIHHKHADKDRWGTAFAFLAQICLGAGVWTAYTQWVWRTLKKKEFRMATLNAAFGVETSVLSLMNIDMWKKLRVGSVMAFFAWYGPYAP
jgi:hypothetical protein